MGTQNQEGWNYDNLRPEGRNLYIFRDTNHASPVIQDRLLKELSSTIAEKKFNVVFTEGAEGLYTLPTNWLPEFLIDGFLKIIGYNDGQNESVIYRLAHQIKKTKGLETKIYGVDSRALMKEELTALKLMAKIAKKIKADTATSDERLYSKLFARKSNLLSDLRTIHSSDAISKIMGRENLVSGAVVYGDYHYPLLVECLNENGIGHASFYPGKVDFSNSDCLRYIENL